eukprot:TCONS_00041458-protein
MVEETELTWQEYWDDETPPWQLKKPNPDLEKYFSDFLNNGEITDGRRVFIPLCGRNLDMKWIYDQGLTVVGVDAIEKPIREFFGEHGIPVNVQELESGYKVFTSPDKRLTLIVGDLFGLDENLVGGRFDYFYDRASLVALDSDTRPNYVGLLYRFLKPGAVGMLESVEYDTKWNTSHPYPLFAKDLEDLYGDQFSFEELSRGNDVSSSYPRIKVAYKVCRNIK